MPVAAIPAITAGIGAGGSIISGLLGSHAAGTAAAQQTAALQKGIDTTNQAVSQGQQGVNAGLGGANSLLSDAAALYAPFVQAGTSSLGSIQALANSGPLAQTFSFNPTDLQSDPGYQFTLQQGQQAIQRAAAAQGNLFSSGTLKSLAGYTTGTANQYFNDAFNRSLSTFDTNRQTALSRIGSLQGLASMGYGATGGQAGLIGQQAQNTMGAGEFNANLGMTGAQNVARMLGQQGDAQAAGTMGSANAWANTVGGVTNSINSYLTQRAAKNNNNAPVRV